MTRWWVVVAGSWAPQERRYVGGWTEEMASRADAENRVRVLRVDEGIWSASIVQADADPAVHDDEGATDDR